MQRQNMHHNQHQENDRHSDNVQGKEAIQSGIRDNKITTNPQCQVITNNRDSTEQLNNNLSTPVRHLTPWQ